MDVTRGCVVTVGTYDGVHLGHRRLLTEAMAEGQRLGLPTVVVTFDQHPVEVLRPDRAPRLLTGLEHKLELLRASGVDAIEVLHFDVERARESAEDFVRNDLVGRLHAAAVLVGSNFRFGHRQGGDVALLQALAGELGFVARGIDLVIDDESHSIVSSSVIRARLAEGAVDEAARLLGRPHEVRGRVDDGEFVLAGRLALPVAGRYAARVGVPGEADTEAVATVTGVDRLELADPARAQLDVGGEGFLAVRFVSRLGADDSEAAAAGTHLEHGS
jgi:riboflavin kinase/FMN adenylyltransferase